jgi:hypothetical protein
MSLVEMLVAILVADERKLKRKYVIEDSIGHSDTHRKLLMVGRHKQTKAN